MLNFKISTPKQGLKIRKKWEKILKTFVQIFTITVLISKKKFLKFFSSFFT